MAFARTCATIAVVTPTRFIWLALAVSLGCKSHPELPAEPVEQTASPPRLRQVSFEEAQKAQNTVKRAVAQVRATPKDFGTAFVVNDQGVLLTAAHVVEGHTQVDIRFEDDKEWTSAKVVHSNRAKDLALLRLDDPSALKNRRPLSFWLSNALTEGTPLYAFGFRPNQRAALFQPGEVVGSSATHQLWSAQIKPGYSGGPVCLRNAAIVVGLNLGEEELGHVGLRSSADLGRYLQAQKVAFETAPYAIGPFYSVSAKPCRPLSMPTRLRDFVGRQAELKTIDDVLSQGGRVSITGIGGTGKTVLASEALWRMSEAGRTRAGVVWVTFGANSDQDIVEDLAKKACRPDLVAEVGRNPMRVLQMLAAHFRAAETIVALDDVRMNSESYDAEAMLCALSEVRYVQTGRSQPKLGCSHDVRPIALAGLDPKWCRELFARRAGISNETPGIAEVCQLLSHHPLAVDISARRYQNVRRSTLDGFIAEMKADGIRGLQVGRGVYQDLTRNFGLSVAQLSPSAAQLYRALGIFAPSSRYDGAALQSVAANADATVFRNDRATLLRLGLLDNDEAAQRFYQHDLLRQDARVRLDAKKETEAVFDRYVRHYEPIAAGIRNMAEAQWDSALAHDRSHLLHALTGLVEAAERSPDDPARARWLIRWAKHLSTYAWKRQIEDAEQPLKVAYEAAVRTKDRASARVLAIELGILVRQFGRAREAIGYYEQALVLSRDTGDRHSESAALGSLGNAYFSLGEVREAIEYTSRR